MIELEHKMQNLVEELKLDFEKLKKFTSNLMSEKFSKFIEEPYNDCRIFEPASDLQNDFNVSEKQLRRGMKEIFLQLQKYS